MQGHGSPSLAFLALGLAATALPRHGTRSLAVGDRPVIEVCWQSHSETMSDAVTNRGKPAVCFAATCDHFRKSNEKLTQLRAPHN